MIKDEFIKTVTKDIAEDFLCQSGGAVGVIQFNEAKENITPNVPYCFFSTSRFLENTYKLVFYILNDNSEIFPFVINENVKILANKATREDAVIELRRKNKLKGENNK